MYLLRPGHINLEVRGISRKEERAENKEIFWNSVVKVKLKQ